MVGILIAYIDLQHAIGNSLLEERSDTHQQGNTLLFDPAGQVLARFPVAPSAHAAFQRNAQVASGFEGTLLQPDALGNTLVVVYRHLSLSGTQGWTLVHYASKDEALGELNQSVNSLAIAGLLLTLAALVLVHLVARRLARPLDTLAQTARRLGAGDLTARAPPQPGDSREIAALADAFSSMAESIQREQLTLENKVQERTAELQRTAAHLRQSEENLAITLQSIGDAVIATDALGHITRMNTTAERLTGWSLAEALGHPLPKVFHIVNTQTRVEAVNPVQMVMERGEVVGLANHTALLARDGQEYQISDSAAPIRDPFGAIVGVVLVFSDVTEDYRVREALVNTAELLKHTGELAKVGGWELDLKTMKFVWSVEIFRIHEMEPPVAPTLEESIALFVPEARPLVQAAVQAAIDFGTPYDLELQKFTAKGQLIWVRVQGSAVMKDGKAVKLMGALHDITPRKAAEEQIRSLAFYDPLTQLPNRRLLMNRLEKALATGARHQRKGALLFVDLDNFKTLNDTLGHDKGDILLQQVAQRLSTCIRECDTVARLGGDEFVVMLEDLSDNPLEAATQAEIVGEKILAALNQIYQLAGYEHHSTPSIGVTLFGDLHEGIDEPLKRADLAMYQAKAAGRNTLRFFDPQMQAVVTARAALEVGLREALDQGQFLLHYQAQVGHGGHATGAEALVRWMHPQRGMVSPAEFIPLAEDTGLILPLGHWVLETACTQLAHWAHQPAMAQLTVAVNVSPRQFHQVDFVEQVLACLAHTGAKPQRLKLELTEGLLVSNIEDVIAKMSALKSAGVGFSLDDFGTGYSSLSYLKRLPLDQLKIDQGFVRDILIDPNDAAIAKMVIVLADSLGLACIAEGVETTAQRNFLAAQGCHAYQGYLFSRPLPVQEFEAFVAASSPAEPHA